MSQLFTLPFVPALSLQGDYMASATLTFYLAGTTTAANVYSDPGLTVSLGNVVTADAYGRFVPIYLSNDNDYRVILKNAGGAIIGDTDLSNQFYSPAFGGTPTAPTPIVTDNSDRIATTAYTRSYVEAQDFLTQTDANAQFANYALLTGVGAFTHKNLKITTIGVNNFASVITADMLVLQPAINGSGANGLDTGALAASTWYYVYAIYNPMTSTMAGLFSASATSPTLPSGYTYFMRLGAVITDSSGSKYLLQTIQKGARVEYVPTSGSNLSSLPLISSGAAGTFTSGAYSHSTVAIGGFFPPTAINGKVQVATPYGSGADWGMSSSSYGYGGFGSVNPPPYCNSAQSGGTQVSQTHEMQLQSTNIYFASSGTAYIYALGWMDAI